MCGPLPSFSCEKPGRFSHRRASLVQTAVRDGDRAGRGKKVREGYMYRSVRSAEGVGRERASGNPLLASRSLFPAPHIPRALPPHPFSGRRGPAGVHGLLFLRQAPGPRASGFGLRLAPAWGVLVLSLRIAVETGVGTIERIGDEHKVCARDHTAVVRLHVHTPYMHTPYKRRLVACPLCCWQFCHPLICMILLP